MVTFSFESTLLRYDGQAAWYFVTVPPDISDEIADLSAGPRRGFGAVRVEVGIGRTTWRTSVFPDSKAGAYILFVKKAVRAAEDLEDGDSTSVRLTLVEQGAAP